MGAATAIVRSFHRALEEADKRSESLDLALSGKCTELAAAAAQRREDKQILEQESTRAADAEARAEAAKVSHTLRVNC